MGILDEAIREHLDLKRQHGAAETEVESLEAEAFGPADRPDAVEPLSTAPSPYSEDETRVISPDAMVAEPTGETEASAVEHVVPDLEPPSTEAAGTAESAPDQIETGADPVAEAPGIAPDALEDEDDAGDALERERHTLAGYPTEHYDVDAAIAEEDEIDVLSESSLSDELDRALDGPPGEPASEKVEAEHEFEPETPAAPEFEEEAESDDEDEQAPDEEEADTDEGEFFDQDDPLEGTPDFLEETPEHDRLWFEQKEPKDFDFGD